MRKLSRKGAIKKLDKLCRDIIWIRDKSTCRKCKILLDRQECKGDVHHILPKKRGYHVRWITNNLILLCAKCHFEWHADPFAIEWFKEEDPDTYDVILELNQQQTQSFKQQDLLERIEVLTRFHESLKR